MVTEIVGAVVTEMEAVVTGMEAVVIGMEAVVTDGSGGDWKGSGGDWEGIPVTAAREQDRWQVREVAMAASVAAEKCCLIGRAQGG